MLVRVLYLIAPAVLAGVAHAAVIKRESVPGLARPISPHLFGANKTWRGPVVMVSVSTAAALVQRALYELPSFRALSIVDYSEAAGLLIGPALGLGYSLAELPNSLVKRRLGVAPGRVARRFRPLQYVGDQGDSVLGATLVLVPFVREPRVLALVAATGFVLHAAFDRLLYVLDVKHLEVGR
jgi:hypothetical protein